MSETVDSDNPYLPVYLPEFDVSVGWAMCRNTMCKNFGIQYAGPAHTDETWLSDGRYEINPNTGKFKCGYCGNSFDLLSNRAIRVLARHFLSLSLPFATCPDSGCENYGYNFFEHYTERWGRDRRYRRKGKKEKDKHRVRCQKCPGKTKKGFSVGVPWFLDRSPEGATPQEVRDKKRRGFKTLRQVIRGAMYYRSIGMILEDFGFDADTYYVRLRRAGNRIRHYHAWRNARLLHPRFARQDTPVRVYTDTLRASLARFGKDTPGYVHLDIPVSVVDLPDDTTYYILAAHPGFLPEEFCQMDLEQLYRDVDVPEHLSPWACTFHPYYRPEQRDLESAKASLPQIGQGGWYTRSPYTELAHFLTVRKMLARFPLVYYYMDAHRAQSEATLTALAGDIRAGRCEIALCQKRTDEPSEAESREPRPSASREEVEAWFKERADRQWEMREGRWPVQGGEGKGGQAPANPMPEEQYRASQFSDARKGAKDVGGWAWLQFPPPGPRYKGGYSLWLTQRPDDTYEDVGRELLWSANVLRVDAAHSHLRDDVRALERATFKAEPGRSFKNSPRNPFNLMAELWIALFWRNYGPRRPPRHKLKKGEKPRLVPAATMGLAQSNEPQKPDLATIAWNFRLGFSEATRMSRWLKR